MFGSYSLLIFQFIIHRAYVSNSRDTVASVGILWSRSLPFTNSNSAIKTFRHALSLDEVSDLVPKIRVLILFIASH